MDEIWYVARRTLRHLLTPQPAWTFDQLATACHQSVSCVKKWKARLRHAPADEEPVLWGCGRK